MPQLKHGTIELVLGNIVDQDTDAFPAISTGAYCFPIDDASRIALDAACGFLNETPGISLVRFVLYSQDQYDVFARSLEQWRPAS